MRTASPSPTSGARAMLLHACLAASVSACADTRVLPGLDAGNPQPFDPRDGSTPPPALDASSTDGAGRHDDAGTVTDAAQSPDAGVLACTPPELHREPGPAVTDRAALGTEACASTTLGEVIDAVRAAEPELGDVVDLFVPDAERLGDQSFIYAFATSEGGFALVFRRGGGDCPAGCTENEYWYFRTDETCAPVRVGHYHPTWSSSCESVEGFALWDHPPPPNPDTLCGRFAAPFIPTGERALAACGQRTQCSKGDATPVALDLELRFAIEQDAQDPARGTLTLLNTGHPQLDGRPLVAEVGDRRILVRERVDNLPATCLDAHDLEVQIDFGGHDPSFLHYLETRTPDCENAPGDYCKGTLDLELGNLLGGRCFQIPDLDALIRQQRDARNECTEDAECAVVEVNAGCYTGCATAVRAEQAGAFTDLVRAAGDAHCADSTCSVDSDCVLLDRAVCRDGRCLAVNSQTEPL